MAESILQTYLNEQHIKVADESSVDNLKKAITQIKKHLEKKKTEIIPFTLVALDPKVKDTDPVVVQVEGIIIKHWKTFANSVKSTNDKSTTYVRAVILESLNQLARSDSNIAALVWLTARDVIEHFHLASEQEVIGELLQQVANKTEENGQATWGIKQRIQTDDFKGAEISISGVKAAQVDEEILKEHLLNASVHPNHAASAGGGKNPHSFQNHNQWQWPQFFSQNSAQGIAEVVNSALAQQSKSLSSISTSIQKSLDDYFDKLQPFFEQLNNSFANSIAANNKRSELIWWKQSLYSRSLNSSYRRLDPLNNAICMAFDLAEHVNTIYPESVDFLLRETLKDVHAEQAEDERPLTDWLEEGNKLNESIKEILEKHVADNEERKPLLNAWANAIKGGKTSDFFEETGIDKKAKLSASDLAVWLFHGLQAQKLAKSK